MKFMMHNRNQTWLTLPKLSSASTTVWIHRAFDRSLVADRLRICKLLIVGLVCGVVLGASWPVWSQETSSSTSQRVAKFNFSPVTSLLEKSVADRAIAGGVAMVSVDARTEYLEAVGQQDVEHKIPMSHKSIFRIASMTKPITSVAVMMLVEEGRLKLEQPVAEILPSFKRVYVLPNGQAEDAAEIATSSITIAHLLSHTSGYTYPFFGQSPHGAIAERLGISSGIAESPLSVIENADRIARWPLVTSPGTSWQYGLSTDILGAVVERASAMPFDEFVQQRILNPLSMHDTHFVLPSDKQDRLATLYRPGKDKKIEPTPVGINRHGTAVYSTTFPLPGMTKYRSGGAGMVSTIGDYGRFLSMLLGGGELDGKRLLEPDSITMMTKNQIGDLSIGVPIHGNKFGYGFGVHTADSERLGASIGTFSWGGMFHTYFWVDPDQRVIGILMTQLFPFDHMTLWGDFQRATYSVLHAPH